MKNAFRQYGWYGLLYALGIAAGVRPMSEIMRQSLQLLEPITLTALIASLLLPFAGFARTEGWQKFVLQYGIVPLFGIYTVILVKEHSVEGVALFACASLVHFSYWMSGIQSRGYRFEQFKLIAGEMPKMSRLVALLNVRGLSHESDRLIVAVIEGRTPDLQRVSQLLSDQRELVRSVREEMSVSEPPCC